MGCISDRLVVAFVASCFVAVAPSAALDPRELWEGWPASRFVTTSAPCLAQEELEERIAVLAGKHPELRVEEAGRSVEGRAIRLLTLGRGAEKVLLWSQMHGDEPSATPALLDLVDLLLERDDDPDVRAILERLTLLVVPRLNPDGAERYSRRNAQGIDINRDALNLATPEGRLLKRLRDEHQPILGFNLHDQNRRRTVGDTGVLATKSVLAVVGDAAKTVTPGRELSLRASVAIASTLQSFIPGGIGRFDDTYSPRAFGDNLTAWGTPVVLIESGGVARGQSLAELSRLNFVALASALAELARDRFASRDRADYDEIPENNADVWSDVVVRGGRILQPGLDEPYRADVAFDRLMRDKARERCPDRWLPRSEVAELGDASVFAAGETIDANGKLLLPSFHVGVEGWRARTLLEAANLDRLARHGVARVVWQVKPRDVGAALERASRLAAAGRPRVEVTQDRSALPPVILKRPLASAKAATLGAALAALEAAARVDDAAVSVDARLARLWPPGSSLRFEGAANFLLVESGEGLGDREMAPLTHLFLEGVDPR